MVLQLPNRAVIIEYSELIGCKPAEFLNRFLEYYLVQQFSDPRNGTREEFVCTLEFRERENAERVAAWLKGNYFMPVGVGSQVLEESNEGVYRVAAALIKNGKMYRIG